MRLTSRSITTAAALGLGTLALPPADWWPWVRGTYVAAPGFLASGLAGALLLVNFSDLQPGSDAGALKGHPRLQRARSLPLSARIAMSVGFGAALSASNFGSLRLDAGVEGWLSRRDVRHPRRWMAGTVAVVSVVNDLVETHHVTPDPEINRS